ncbi:hypothetical protein KAU32_11935, partial [bacterium]|nr:hypothetical protein [bacterium]
MNKKISLTIIGVIFFMLSVSAEFDLNEAQGFLPNQKYLIDTENINLCNGNVNINSAEVSLILNSETSIPLSRVYNSKIWTTHQIPIYRDNPDGSRTQTDLKLQVGLVSNYESFHSFGLGWELGIPRISECS